MNRRSTIVGVAIGVTALVLVAGVGLSGLGAVRTTGPRSSPRPRVTATATARAAPTAHDSGSREHAAGPATLVQPGRYRYVVRPGDTFLGIASRFHVCTYDLDAGRPLADQGVMLTTGTPITVQLGVWPSNADGTVDCVWDGSDHR